MSTTFNIGQTKNGKFIVNWTEVDETRKYDNVLRTETAVYAFESLQEVFELADELFAPDGKEDGE